MIIPYSPAKGRAELIPTQCAVVPAGRKSRGCDSLSSELRGKKSLQALVMEVGSKALLRSARLPGIKGPPSPGAPGPSSSRGLVSREEQINIFL